MRDDLRKLLSPECSCISRSKRQDVRPVVILALLTVKTHLIIICDCFKLNITGTSVFQKMYGLQGASSACMLLCLLECFYLNPIVEMGQPLSDM